MLDYIDGFAMAFAKERSNDEEADSAIDPRQDELDRHMFWLPTIAIRTYSDLDLDVVHGAGQRDRVTQEDISWDIHRDWSLDSDLFFKMDAEMFRSWYKDVLDEL